MKLEDLKDGDIEPENDNRLSTHKRYFVDTKGLPHKVTVFGDGDVWCTRNGEGNDHTNAWTKGALDLKCHLADLLEQMDRQIDKREYERLCYEGRVL